VYESLRYNDYSAQNSLGEIIDNSIEAEVAKIEVKFTTEKIQKAGKRKLSESITEIAVIDDGCGMNVETLHKCLALGESIRASEKKSIGRFGVGMTLGGISLSRRIEVYSRTRGGEDFLYTYIDLDDIHQGKLISIPLPVAKKPPEK
jgi:hypothetical protein